MLAIRRTVEQLVLIEPWRRGGCSAVLICAVGVAVDDSNGVSATIYRWERRRSQSQAAASTLPQILLCARAFVCLCALVYACVCVLVLSWISSSVPDSYITRPKKVSWLARVYFAFVARRVHTSLARLAHLTQNPKSRFWVSETKSEFRSDRERVSFFVSCSLAADAECRQCQCIKFFFFVVFCILLLFFSQLPLFKYTHTHTDKKHRDLAEITQWSECYCCCCCCHCCCCQTHKLTLSG